MEATPEQRHAIRRQAAPLTLTPAARRRVDRLSSHGQLPDADEVPPGPVPADADAADGPPSPGERLPEILEGLAQRLGISLKPPR